MLNPYIVYIRLAVFAVLLGFLAFFAYKVHSWRSDALQLGAVRQEMESLKASQEASHAASRNLQDELTKLRTARKPAPVIRVCKPAKQVPGAGAGRNGATTGAGELPQEAGLDTGPIYQLADEADELAARLRACQALLK
jgi:hypothetical protein